MQEYLKLMHIPNNAMPGNTVDRGPLLRTHLAICGARLRRSTTSAGAASTTGQGTTAGVLPLHLDPCVDSAGCWNTLQKPEHGRPTDWPRPPELAGSDASMVVGFAKCGKAHTDTERRKQRGSTTTAQSRRCNCAGTGRPARTKLDSSTSAGKRRTSQRLDGAKRMQRLSSFGTRLSLWRDKQREVCCES